MRIFSRNRRAFPLHGQGGVPNVVLTRGGVDVAFQLEHVWVEALIPSPAPGQQLDPSQLPQGLPSSIQLKPELRLDGQTVATGSAMRAGAEPVGTGGFTRYGSSNQWDISRDQLIAGQQTAIGLSIQGISPKQMQRLKDRMEQAKQKLEQALALPATQRAAALQGITGEHLTGDCSPPPSGATSPACKAMGPLLDHRPKSSTCPHCNTACSMPRCSHANPLDWSPPASVSRA